MPRGIRVFAKCRNEMLRLPAFLAHYRALGTDEFFIVDNDSSDGTTDFLDRQPDVRVFRTAARFSDARGGADWINSLLAEFGGGRWCVTVDIDELLVYPGSERTGLPELTAFLDRQRCEALSCLLLDLYPDGRLRDCRYRAGDDLVGAAPFFDPGPYTRTAMDGCPPVLIRGGMRERVFYPEFSSRGASVKARDWLVHRALLRLPIVRDLRAVRALKAPTPPCLTKVPLVRWNAASRYVYANHWIAPQRVAAETGVLLHFKFLQDFHQRAVQEAARGQYYEGAVEYRRYAEVLERAPDPLLVFAGSRRYEGTAQLVRLGLMTDSAEWAAARRR